MIGVGEVFVERRAHAGRRRRSRDAGLAPLELGAEGGAGAAQRHAVLHRLRAGRPVRGRARCSSRRWSTGALSTDAARGSDTPFDPRIHALRRHRGQIEAAAALRALMAGSAIRASHLTRRRARAGPLLPALPAAGDGRRARPAAAGGARRSAIEANGVSDNPLIFAETDEALSGGNFHAEPVAFAADMIALAICEIGSLAERRDRHAGRSRAVGPAGVPDAASPGSTPAS